MQPNYLLAVILGLFLTASVNSSELPKPLGITLGQTTFSNFVKKYKLDNECKLKSRWNCSAILGNTFGMEPWIMVDLNPWPYNDSYGLIESEYQFLFKDKANSIRHVKIGFFTEVMEYVMQKNDRRTDISQLIKIKGHPTQKYYKYLVSKYGDKCYLIPNRFGGMYRWDINGVRVELKPAEISYYLLDDEAIIVSYILEKSYDNLRSRKQKEKQILNNL